MPRNAIEDFFALGKTKEESPVVVTPTKSEEPPAPPPTETRRPISTVVADTSELLTDYDSIPNLAANIYGIDDITTDLSILLTLDEAKNILVYGTEGIGKTEIVNGLIAASRNGSTSLDVMKRVFFRLNVENLLANDDIAKITHNLEAIVATLERRDYTVLVVDNAWNLFDGLKNKSAFGAISTLMGGISNRRFQSIMIVSDKHLEEILALHPAFKEIFTPYKIQEQDDEQTLNTLRGKRAFYQTRYGIVISDESIKTVAELSKKYPTKYAAQLGQPGRAVRLLEFMCASYRNSFMSKPKELIELETQHRNLMLETDSINHSDPQRLAAIQNSVKGINQKLIPMQQEWQTKIADILNIVKRKHEIVEKLESYTQELTAVSSNKRADINYETKLHETVEACQTELAKLNDSLKHLNVGAPTDHPLDKDEVYGLFEEYTDITITRQNEIERVMELEGNFKKRIVGQDEAVHSMSMALRKNAAGLSAEGRPIGSFFCIGPTGVGKSEAGIVLDEFVTGIPGSKPIVFDMTEFKESHTVATLLGAPPGYAGEDKGGLLINKVNEKRRGVIMFDEIEKSHPDIFDVLVPILDKGKVASRTGQEANLFDFVPIVTSNIGAKFFLDTSLTFEEAQKNALALLYSMIRPEILGRFSEIIFFKRLTEAAQVGISKKFNILLDASLKKQNFSIDISDATMETITKKYYDANKGGRSLRNVFDGKISALATNIVLEEKLKASKGVYGEHAKNPPGGIIHVVLNEAGEFVSNFEAAK